MSENSSKTYDLVALENSRIAQGWSYEQLGKLASLHPDTVRQLLSPFRHKERKRQFKYFRVPANVLRIAFALQLKEEEYLKASPPTPPEAP